MLRLPLFVVVLIVSGCFSKTQLLAQDTTASKTTLLSMDLDRRLQTYRSVYDFKKGEVIASIGAGSGYNEIVYSLMADSLSFYLQDIDVAGLDIHVLESNVQQIYQRAGRTYCNTTFLTIRGSETNTNLPAQLFDKIIAEHSLHEFTRPSEMLQSIRANLKPGGSFFVEELIAKRPNRTHPVCHKTFFTEKTLHALLDANGFRLVNKTAISQKMGGGVVFQYQLR
ncbi:class I SAM-dependent methyltransferase [Fibrisoma montanum]|uniref:Class I SAM-dependent methyltransferase n=2 Tax=Fibrisoma montanum TaxID=2305895 RepID=A0A418MES5_9BACT|nr:class I SAM-dependent methyltransferase [Fibrisoma montanum]